MRERRVGGVVYHTSPAGARAGGMGHFARSQQPSAVKVRVVLVRAVLHHPNSDLSTHRGGGWLGLGTQTMVNESDWLALVNRLKHNLYNERCVSPSRRPHPSPLPRRSHGHNPCGGRTSRKYSNSSTRSCSEIATA